MKQTVTKVSRARAQGRHAFTAIRLEEQVRKHEWRGNRTKTEKWDDHVREPYRSERKRKVLGPASSVDAAEMKESDGVFEQQTGCSPSQNPQHNGREKSYQCVSMLKLPTNKPQNPKTPHQQSGTKVLVPSKT